MVGDEGTGTGVRGIRQATLQQFWQYLFACGHAIEHAPSIFLSMCSLNGREAVGHPNSPERASRVLVQLRLRQ